MPSRTTYTLLHLALLGPLASAQWSVETMNAPRNGCASVAVDRYLLVAGGEQGGSLQLSSVEAYDTVTGTWVPSHPLSAPRAAIAATSFDGRAYFAGGKFGGGAGTPTTRVDVYDSNVGPPADPAAWSVTFMNEPRAGAGAAAVGSSVMIGAGRSATVDVLDTTTGLWTVLPLSGSGSCSAVTVGSTVVFAGHDAAGGTMDVYDDSTATWTVAPQVVPRGPTAAVAGHFALFAGGSSGGVATSAVDVYDASTGTWSAASLSVPRSTSAAAVGDLVLFGGGRGVGVNPQFSDVVDVFDATTGTWSTMSLSMPRQSGPAASNGDVALFPGGRPEPTVLFTAHVDVYRLPEVLIEIDGQRPEALDKDGAVVPVRMTERLAGTLDPASPTLHVDRGSGFQSTPLVAVGGADHEAHFPPLECGEVVDWYVSVATTSGAVLTSPDRAPSDAIRSRAADDAPAAIFDMETPAGWTVGAPGDTATQGLWTRVDPVGSRAQPELDHSHGAGSSCWVTGQGVAFAAADDDDVDGGATTLVSPPIDLTLASDPWVAYWRWFRATSAADTLEVAVTDDGSVWHTIETSIGGPASTIGWKRREFRLLDVPGLELTDRVQLRFVAADEGTDGLVEAAVDDVRVDGCRLGPGSVYCLSNVNSTGALSHLASTGSRQVAQNDVTLHATHLPANAAGFFLASLARDVVPSAGSSAGTLCLGGSIGRYVGPGQVQDSGAAGAFSLVLDLGSTPTPTGLVAVAPGETWHFQAWHRDILLFPTSNFTNGLAIGFQ